MCFPMPCQKYTKVMHSTIQVEQPRLKHYRITALRCQNWIFFKVKVLGRQFQNDDNIKHTASSGPHSTKKIQNNNKTKKGTK